MKIKKLLTLVFVVVIFSLFASQSTLARGEQAECGRFVWNDWFSGETIRSDRVCEYTFYGITGDYVSIMMEHDARSPWLDPYLELKDPYGRIIAYDDDGYGFPDPNSWIDEHRLPSNGWYTILARSYNDASFGEFWLYVEID